jgi:hypothetical protein
LAAPEEAAPEEAAPEEAAPEEAAPEEAAPEEAEPGVALEPLEPADEQPDIRRAAPTATAAPAMILRIMYPFSIGLVDKEDYTPDQHGRKHRRKTCNGMTTRY